MSINLKELTRMSIGLKLLYVEDDDSARETTLKLLNNFFKDITVAVDGKDGIKQFEDGSFDLILSDINMPNLNGIEMLKVIREKNQEIPILFLSAYNDSQYILQAIELDIEGYILKPLEQSQFLKAIFKIVQKIKLLTLNLNYKNELEAEVKSRNEEIEYKLNYDSLTKLFSRYSFFRDIKRLDSPVIILIDIDKFKIINEVYGSDVGSKVLEKFATYLSLYGEEETCLLYRLSADEFAILDTSKYIDTDKYESLLETLFKELNNLKIKIGEYIITVDITIGLSSVKENGYESAKIALDYAKKHKKPFIMYSSSIDHRKESGLTLKCRDNISSAIDDKRVLAVYQPIVNKEGKTVKHETLMRLQEDKTLELISPFHFLDVAIKTRLYEYLSSTIIFSALNKLKDSKHTLSINFTYSDINNIPLITKMDEFYLENKEIGNRSIFEITESETIANYDDVKNFIKHFRKYGVKIAIDDFGSGFSNFEYILAIEPDYLKIDGSLIKDIDTDSRAHTLVEAIVQFSHKLGIKVIAEYVHSKIIFEMLKELDVDEYQGYYFSEPLEEIGHIQ
ncbi:MAG: diguanylate cyclase (GGDEF)-like protein [Sulfurimonas sp.]|jgi:diguanylate cyclase (GGDEF)-like protein|uniref:EAL domain-containing response regulator n=1 Tax=Sulfurimonas sp. TaxID=2022749 RepID=UPI0039E3BB14